MTDPIIRAGRRLFSPGPPTFDAHPDGTWTESADARARCVFCQDWLAQGDPIACPACRLLLDMTPFIPASQED